MKTVTTKVPKGADVFLQMWEAWEAIVPSSLIHENPRVLLHLLELSARPEGIFQSELTSELDVNQPRLSKLTTKLCKAGLVNVSPWKDDRRKVRTKASVSGRAMLASLNQRLSALGTTASAPRRPRTMGKRNHVAEGQTTADFTEYLPPG